MGDGRRRIRGSRSFFIFDYIAVSKPLSKKGTRHKIPSHPCLKIGRELTEPGEGVSAEHPESSFPTFSVLITVQSPEPFVVTLSIPPSFLPSPALLCCFPPYFPSPLSISVCPPGYLCVVSSHLYCVGQKPNSAVPQELLTLSFETVSLWDPELSHCTKLSGQQAHQAVGSDLGL